MIFSTFRPDVSASLRASTADAFAPVLKTISMPLQNASFFVRDVSGLAEMQSENRRLMAENERLREWYQTALLLQAENKSFRELLNVKDDPVTTFITARTLSDSSNAFANTLLVASGSADGIQKDLAVMSGQGMIGRIIEVGEKASRVLLITDINSRVPVLIENTNQHAILAGDNNGKAKLMHVPVESKTSEGARIITSGHGGVFPPGLPVGILKHDKAGIPFVEPLADMGSIVYVRIAGQKPDPYLRQGALFSE